VFTGVASDAKTHIQIEYRRYPVHVLNRTVASLAGDALVDVNPMAESHKRGKDVYPVPANLKRRFMPNAPWSLDGLDPLPVSGTVAPRAALHRRHSREIRAASVCMTVQTRNMTLSRVYPMTEGNGLNNSRSWQPRPFGKEDEENGSKKQTGRQTDKHHTPHRFHPNSGKIQPAFEETWGRNRCGQPASSSRVETNAQARGMPDIPSQPESNPSKSKSLFLLISVFSEKKLL
jgi:hypothetical protein